jgi:hypothetical protein
MPWDAISKFKLKNFIGNTMFSTKLHENKIKLKELREN